MKKQAFTLVEIIVVLFILALLTTASFAAFGEVRRQSRDNARVVAVTQLQTALRSYYRDVGSYPTQLVAGTSLSTTSTVYMEQIPYYPQPVDGSCRATTTYDYFQDSGGSSYRVSFCIGYKTSDVAGGYNTLTPNGIISP